MQTGGRTKTRTPLRILGFPWDVYQGAVRNPVQLAHGLPYLTPTCWPWLRHGPACPRRCGGKWLCWCGKWPCRTDGAAGTYRRWTDGPVLDPSGGRYVLHPAPRLFMENYMARWVRTNYGKLLGKIGKVRTGCSRHFIGTARSPGQVPSRSVQNNPPVVAGRLPPPSV